MTLHNWQLRRRDHSGTEYISVIGSPPRALVHTTPPPCEVTASRDTDYTYPLPLLAVLPSMSDVPASSSSKSTSQPPASPLDEQSIFSTLLTPGSSLHPTLLLLLDAAFLVLFLLFISLAIATNGNVHILVLMGIEVALWASVKWCVYLL